MLQCQNTLDLHFNHAQVKLDILFGSLTLYPALLSGVDTLSTLLFCWWNASHRLLPLIGFTLLIHYRKSLDNVMDLCVIQISVPVTQYPRWMNLNDLLEGPTKLSALLDGHQVLQYKSSKPLLVSQSKCKDLICIILWGF